MTPKELVETFQTYTYRFYSYDTPIECQNKLISKLEEHFAPVITIRSITEMENWKSYDFSILIIQHAGLIIDGLRSLEPLEQLIESTAIFLIFFNGKAEYQIGNSEKRNQWKTLLQGAKYLYQKSLVCREKPFPTPGPGKSLSYRMKEVKTWTLEYLGRKMHDFFDPPWSRKKVITIFLFLLVLLVGVLSFLFKLPFLPFFIASLIASPIVISLLVHLIRIVREKAKESWVEFVIIVLAVLNLFVGLTVSKIFNFLYEIFSSTGG